MPATGPSRRRASHHVSSDVEDGREAGLRFRACRRAWTTCRLRSGVSRSNSIGTNSPELGSDETPLRERASANPLVKVLGHSPPTRGCCCLQSARRNAWNLSAGLAFSMSVFGLQPIARRTGWTLNLDCVQASSFSAVRMGGRAIPIIASDRGDSLAERARKAELAKRIRRSPTIKLFVWRSMRSLSSGRALR